MCNNETTLIFPFQIVVVAAAAWLLLLSLLLIVILFHNRYLFGSIRLDVIFCWSSFSIFVWLCSFCWLHKAYNYKFFVFAKSLSKNPRCRPSEMTRQTISRSFGFVVFFSTLALSVRVRETYTHINFQCKSYSTRNNCFFNFVLNFLDNYSAIVVIVKVICLCAVFPAFFSCSLPFHFIPSIYS